MKYLEQDLDALERGNGGLGDPSGDSTGDELLDDKGHRALDEALERPSAPLFSSSLLLRHRYRARRTADGVIQEEEEEEEGGKQEKRGVAGSSRGSDGRGQEMEPRRGILGILRGSRTRTGEPKSDKSEKPTEYRLVPSSDERLTRELLYSRGVPCTHHNDHTNL